MKRSAIALAMFLAVSVGGAPAAKADDGQPLESVFSVLESWVQVDLSWIWAADQLDEAEAEPAEPVPDSPVSCKTGACPLRCCSLAW